MVQGSKLADIGPGGTFPDTVGFEMGFETPWAEDGELECARIQLPRKTSIFAGCAALSMLSAMSGRDYCKKKMLENDVRSGNVYENKGNADKMPVKKSDIFV